MEEPSKPRPSSKMPSLSSETAYVFGGSSYGEYSAGGSSGAFAEAERAAEQRARSGH